MKEQSTNRSFQNLKCMNLFSAFMIHSSGLISIKIMMNKDVRVKLCIHMDNKIGPLEIIFVGEYIIALAHHQLNQ